MTKDRWCEQMSIRQTLDLAVEAGINRHWRRPYHAPAMISKWRSDGRASFELAAYKPPA
jgi:hypothetical protein